MKVVGTISALVLLVVGQSSAKSCKTCRGAGCLSEEVFELDCTKFVPALPFESMLFPTEVSEASQYGCLDLSYYSGDSLEHLQQCILVSDISSYCDMLENILKVKSCNIGAASEGRKPRRAAQLKEDLRQEDEISEDDGANTETPPVPTESSSESGSTSSIETTTAGASVTVLFPFTSLVTIIVAFLL